MTDDEMCDMWLNMMMMVVMMNVLELPILMDVEHVQVVILV